MGAQFFRVSGGDSYRLQDLSVPGSMEWVTVGKYSYWDCDYVDPSMEFIRIFRTDVLKERIAYTYISKPAIVALLGFDFDGVIRVRPQCIGSSA